MIRFAGLWELAGEVGAPRVLGELGLREGQIDEVAVLTEPAVPEDNPMPVDTGALRRLVRAAWGGEWEMRSQ